jgi:hypothetical protein
MTDADDMIHIAQSELQQFVRQDARSICKSKQRMIRKHRPQIHRPGMQDSLMAKTAQARMAVHNLNLFPDDDVSKYRKKGEDCWKSGFSIDDKEWYMIYFEAVR